MNLNFVLPKFLLSTAMLVLLGVPRMTATNPDLKVIFDRMNSASLDIANEKRPVPTHSTNINTLLASLNKFNADGSYIPGIPDITEAEKQNAASKWDKHKAYLKDVANIAVLYGYNRYYPGKIAAPHPGNEEYKALVYRTLKWYFANHTPPTGVYHETFSYHPYSDNLTGLLSYIGMLLYDDFHADRLKDSSIQKLFDDMVRYNHHVLTDNPQTRGPNWAFRYGNCMRHVLFSDDTVEMNTYMKVNDASIDFDVWAENGTDGVWPDWSLTHHGDMNYWGMYGTSWFARTLDLATIVKGTKWEYTKREVQFLEASAVEGLQWILFHGNTEITTAPKRLTYYLDRTDNAAEVVSELKRLVLLHGDKLKDKDQLIRVYNNIDPSWQESSKTYHEVTGHKYYWNTEYQVHRRENYSIAVRRTSQRVRGPEDSSNSDVKMHLHFGSGYTSILRRGDEYRLSRLGLDYQSLPGTTTERNGVVNAGKSGSVKRGVSLFSGGVAEGGFGAGAFEMKLGEYNPATKNWDLINGAGALKGNFFFEHEMLCLGMDVKRIKSGTDEIWTTLNQLQRRGEVVYALDHKPPVHVGLDDMVSTNMQMDSTAWFWHDQVGYIITSKKAVDLKFLAERRTLNPLLMQDKSYVNALSPEDRAAGTINMFQLAINHGANPENQTYAYYVIPDVGLDEMKVRVNINPTLILQNADGIQAVFNAKDKVLQAVFYQAGAFTFDADKSIAVDKKAIVQIRQQKDTLVVSVANPVHRGLTPSFVSSNSKTIGELYTEPVHVRLTGFGLEAENQGTKVLSIQLPEERAYEGKTISTHEKIKPGGGFGEVQAALLNKITMNGKDLPGFDPKVFFYEMNVYVGASAPVLIEATTHPENTLTRQQRGDTTKIGVQGRGGNALYTVVVHRKGEPLKRYTETFEQLVNDGGLMTKTFVGDNEIAWNLHLAKYSKHQRTGGGVYIRSGDVQSEHIGTGIGSLSVSLMNKYVDDGDSTLAAVYINDSLYMQNYDHSENEVYLLELDSIHIAGAFQLKISSDSSGNKALVIDNISWTPYPASTHTAIHPTRNTQTRIYPNPSAGTFTVQAESAYHQLELFTVSGEKLLSQDIAHQSSITLGEAYANGIYLLKLSGQGMSEIHKIVLAR